jgi:hypothetical protein
MRLEKRKDNRLVLSVPIQYKIFNLDRLEMDIRDPSLGMRALLQDLSLGGIQVVSSEAFQSGVVLELELEIPGKGPVRSVAKVVWCNSESFSGGFEYRSGIQFIPVYEEDLIKLEEYLRPERP